MCLWRTIKALTEPSGEAGDEEPRKAERSEPRKMSFLFSQTARAAFRGASLKGQLFIVSKGESRMLCIAKAPCKVR